ncbi:MAG: hypothetical protein AAFW76_03790, partial [Pseudomonadota bacterium]
FVSAQITRHLAAYRHCFLKPTGKLALVSAGTDCCPVQFWRPRRFVEGDNMAISRDWVQHRVDPNQLNLELFSIVERPGPYTGLPVDRAFTQP